MKDQTEKIVWLILAWGVLAFAVGNISGYLIRDAQKQPVTDSISFIVEHSEIRK